MALDTTIAGATADSYATLVEFDAWLALKLHAPISVTTATVAQKENALRLAAINLDSYLCLMGTPTTTTQALRFPRAGLVDQNGVAITSMVIPLGWKRAQMELAYLLLQGDRTAENATMVAGLTKLKVGSIELGFKNDITVTVIPDSVRTYILTSWLCPVPDLNVPILEML